MVDVRRGNSGPIIDAAAALGFFDSDPHVVGLWDFNGDLSERNGGQSFVVEAGVVGFGYMNAPGVTAIVLNQGARVALPVADPLLSRAGQPLTVEVLQQSFSLPALQIGASCGSGVADGNPANNVAWQIGVANGAGLQEISGLAQTFWETGAGVDNTITSPTANLSPHVLLNVPSVVALTRDGAGRVRLYGNGSLLSESTGQPLSDGAELARVHVGTAPGGTEATRSSIGGLRISSVERTAEEIREQYMRVLGGLVSVRQP